MTTTRRLSAAYDARMMEWSPVVCKTAVKLNTYSRRSPEWFAQFRADYHALTKPELAHRYGVSRSCIGKWIREAFPK